MKNKVLDKKSISDKMKKVIFILPLFLSLLFLFIKLYAPGVYFSLIQEDSAMEYFQFVFYFSASITCVFIAKNFIKVKALMYGFMYTILSIGLFVIAAEEISWGQRILAIENPSFFEKHNVQKEISLHNLNEIQGKLHNSFILLGLYGSLAWILSYVISSKHSLLLKFVIPDWFVSSYYYPIFFTYLTLEHLHRPRDGGFLLWRDQEPAELILSIGFLVFALANYRKLNVTAQLPDLRSNLQRKNNHDPGSTKS